jgi:hypothetical protein
MKKQLLVTVEYPDDTTANVFMDIAIKSVLHDIDHDCEEGWSVSYSDVPTVDVWALNSYGNHTCVDCETEVDPKEVLGNREFGEPRCEDCYDTHRYGS